MPRVISAICAPKNQKSIEIYLDDIFKERKKEGNRRVVVLEIDETSNATYIKVCEEKDRSKITVYGSKAFLELFRQLKQVAG